MRLLVFALLAAIGIGAPAYAETLNAKDIASLESTGTMRDISAGAFEKTFWRGNERSAIIAGLEALPPESPLRAIHDLKRRLLLSQSDTGLIENDVPPTTDDNLFIARLEKLQDMGLYEEALRLYTDNIDTPRDARLAETGLILITHQRGLATACLEEKVLAPQFPEDAFFTMMDEICSFTLGQSDTPPDLDSIILKAAFKQETFKLPAHDLDTFAKLSPLEMAVLKSEGHIDYAAFDTAPGALKPYPARVLMTFLEDKTLPGERLLPLQIEMTRRGYVSVNRLPAWKEAHILTVDVEDKRRKGDEPGAIKTFWDGFTPLLRRDADIVTLTPYGATLASMPPHVDGADLYKALAVILASGNNLTPAWCEKIRAQEAPEAALYYETLTFLRACEMNADKAVDNLETSLQAISPQENAKLLIIMGLLAPDTPEYAPVKSIYEKDFPLTSAFDYVMHTQGNAPEIPKTKASEGFGVALLATLAAVKGETGENINPAVLQITVKSLLDEGLDADARQLAKEVLVGLLLKTKMKDGEYKNG